MAYFTPMQLSLSMFYSVIYKAYAFNLERKKGRRQGVCLSPKHRIAFSAIRPLDITIRGNQCRWSNADVPISHRGGKKSRAPFAVISRYQ
jgi:hypothetical protein